MSKKYVYLFSEGNGSMRELLGGKGANLAEMTVLGLPVPQGFTITTEACTRYYEDGEQISDDIKNQIFEYVAKMEDICGKKFGDKKNPLLVSVRSGARASMPGMMDTILNLGLNDDVAEGMIELTGNPRFVYDSYRRLIQTFADVVMGMDKSRFETIIDEVKETKGVKLDIDLDTSDMIELVRRFKEFYRECDGNDFPSDPKEQLMSAAGAVFRSWNNDRAITYRRLNDIPGNWGTAVNIQSMVFGNMGETSGTGVAFTRNPSTGEKKLYGEFLMNAQGEDVVAGVRTPSPIAALEDSQPEIYAQFSRIAETLENHYRDMQDMEFTVENGKLYMLQTRNGKRTAQAAIKVAVDLVSEGMCTKEEAILKIEPKQLDSLLHPQFDPDALKTLKPISSGLPASPGAACGQVFFSAEDAVRASTEKGIKSLLVRLETSPEDIEGMNVAEGILTARGGMTSHAAVVARGMGKCCVAGCSELSVNEKEKIAYINGVAIHEGDFVSLNGSTGDIYIGIIPTVEASVSGDFATIMGWADDIRDMKVRTNADNPHDAAVAVNFGAEGIGLCRTEHMFFEADRIKAVREMIVAKNADQRRRALDKILPMQRGDFEGIYRAMKGRPVTIRFLDPPLHEFLPSDPADIAALAAEMELSVSELEETVSSLHEFNPMMGHRGCRLAVSYPEIAEMQTRAVIEAAINVNREGINIIPEIMVPLVGDPKEFRFVRDIIRRVADEIISESGVALEYKIGTMIEIPRGALLADEIAKDAEFFSFGTNDLTQMTFGFSRDDAGKFLDDYYKTRIYENDPFAKFDQQGTGKLLKIASQLGRSTRPDIKLGVCGEHGGDPASVEFFYQQGLNYVSCSPYRVPLARLAAAQATIKSR